VIGKLAHYVISNSPSGISIERISYYVDVSFVRIIGICDTDH